jgi:probable F420-dependent oxidoreductase
VKVGIATMNNPGTLRIDALAALLEDRGFESLWVGEHSHIPITSPSPYPGGRPLPDQYKRMMDPFVSLMAAAAATTTLKIGTAVTLLLERDLFATAKEVSTLDLLSDGRVILGVGVGWNRLELADHTDIPWSKRYRAIREYVTVLKLLWTEEEPSFEGEFFRFDPLWSYPKPVQQPHPPILLGCAGNIGMSHVVEWADGWFPIGAALEDLGAAIKDLQHRAEDAGRDPATIEITITDREFPELDVLRGYADLGVDRVLVGNHPLKPLDESKLRAGIDAYAELIPQLD